MVENLIPCKTEGNTSDIDDHSHPEFPKPYYGGKLDEHMIRSQEMSDAIKKKEMMVNWSLPIKFLYEGRKERAYDARIIGMRDNMVVVYVQQMPHGTTTTPEYYEFKQDGSMLYGEHKIINTPPPPRKCEAWVNVHDINGVLEFGNVHFQEETAHKVRTPRCIDTIKIEYVEKPKGE